jgi:single-strand DNA-binding protein
MFNVNRVTLLGNVTRDPEAKVTKNGQHVGLIGLATNRVWKDANGETQKEPEFHRLVCWGGLADFASSHVAKGAPLYVEGRLRTSSWEKEGKKASRTEIMVDRLVLLNGRKKGEEVAAAEAVAA